MGFCIIRDLEAVGLSAAFVNILQNVKTVTSSNCGV